MPTWTLSMRMTLHCLFATHKYERTDDDWWRIWKSIHGTSRERQKVYDDYSQRESETRSTMYRKQILKPTRSYTPEESQTWSEVHDEVARHAKKLNIALPAQEENNSADEITQTRQRNVTEGFRRDDSAPSSSSKMNPTQGPPMASYPSGSSTSPPKLEKHPSSTALVPQSSSFVNQQPKPEDGNTKRKTTDTPTTAPSEPANKKRIVSEAGSPGVLQRASETLTERLFRHFLRLRNNEAFRQWEANTMNRIIWKPITRQNSLVREGAPVTSSDPLPSAETRLISYCTSVFGERFGNDEQAALRQSLPEGWIKDGKLLPDDQVWDRVFPNPQERPLLLPRFLPFYSFSRMSEAFPNFQIALFAFGKGLQMYHYSDVKWKGHRGGQPVLGAVNTKPMEQITRINTSDPVFKRGGRVYSVRVDQPNALGIMGVNPREGMASIQIDCMICDPLFCTVCNPKLKDSSADVRTSTGLPRVHARFLKSGNVFTFGDVKNKNDHDEQFIHDVKSGVVEVIFWDQHKEDVIICDRSSCPGCIEYAQLWV